MNILSFEEINRLFDRFATDNYPGDDELAKLVKAEGFELNANIIPAEYSWAEVRHFFFSVYTPDGVRYTFCWTADDNFLLFAPDGLENDGPVSLSLKRTIGFQRDIIRLHYFKY